MDPVAAIAEGSLIITAKTSHSERIIEKLSRENISASIVGRVTEDMERRTMKRISGEVEELRIPEQDPFWPVFFEGL